MSRDPVEPFYKRYPKRALRGALGLGHDEIAVYFILLELMYEAWRPLPFDSEGEKSFVFGWLPKSRQKNSPIIARLIDEGRIKEVVIGGKLHLSDDVFERVCAEYDAKSPGKATKKSGKSQGEVKEKSERSTPLLDPDNEENQSVKGARIEENREDNTAIEAVLSSTKTPVTAPPYGGRAAPAKAGKRGKVARPEPAPPQWSGDPDVRARVANDSRYGEGFAVSYIDTAMPCDAGIMAGTHYAAGKLKGCEVLGLKVFPPT